MTTTVNNASLGDDDRRYGAAQRDADGLRDLIRQRTGLASGELVCPREKSAMTPCIARDGGLAVTLAIHGGICVGCERTTASLLDAERLKHGSA